MNTLTNKLSHFPSQAVRISTEEAISYKRNTEDEILRAFQALDVDKKGYLEAHELQTLMTTYGEKFSNEEVQASHTMPPSYLFPISSSFS